VLALAVIHHLLVGANLPMSAIRDLFASITQKHLVLEFVPTDDVMFRKLIEFRVNLFESRHARPHCLEVFGETFALVRQEADPELPPHAAAVRKDALSPFVQQRPGAAIDSFFAF
jgi:hypothetical protein